MNKGKGKFSFALFYQKFGVFILLVIIFVIASVLSRNFLKPQNLINVLRQVVIISIISFGGCYMLICAQINIAYDGLIAFFGCMSTMIMLATGSAVITFILVLLMGAVEGYIFGSCVTRLNIPSFIVGLAINSVAAGAIIVITGGARITGMAPSFDFFGKSQVGPFPISIIIMLVCLTIAHVILTKTTFGRKVFAVGGNKQAAIASGINAGSVIRRVFIIDGMMTAVAAVIFMSRLGLGNPSAGKGYAFDAITGAVVGGSSIYGGKGTITGCLTGAAIVGILNNILSLMNVSAYWQSVFSGGIILLAVLIDIATKEAASVAIKNQMAEKEAA